MKNYFQYLHEILTLLGDDRRKLPKLVVMFLLISFFDLAGLGLIAPYISLVINPDKFYTGSLGNLMNDLGIEQDWGTLILFIGLGLVLIFLCKAFANLWIQYKITSFSQRQKIRLQTYLMQTYQHLPYQVYLRRNSSEYVYSIMHLVGNFTGVLILLLRTLSDGMIACVIIFVLAWQNLLILGLLLCLLGGMVVVYDRSFRKLQREYGKRNNEASQQIVQSLNEAIEGLKELRILGKEVYFYQRLEQGAKLTAYFALRNTMLNIAPSYLMEFGIVAFVVGILSSYVWLGGTLTDIVPTMGVFGVAAMRLRPMANGLASSLITFRFHRDSIRRLAEDLQSFESLESPATPPRSLEKAIAPFQELTLSEASFSYSGMSQPALYNVSLRIQKGESIGLIGPSGSGKTTLVDLLLGLLEPQSGTMKFNGCVLKEVLEDWRSQVAYLPQQVFLIDNTLKNNVALGEEERDIDERLLLEALSQAQLAELVEQLPHGVDTLLGERGVRLSGGQRQRVALARAFYHRRNVLVMDEATSALDNETEKEIVTEIKRLKSQKTIIVIAHRLTTVQHCDRIYRLEQGRIIQAGTPEQVLKKAS